jgi:hypothetical protein
MEITMELDLVGSAEAARMLGIGRTNFSHLRAKHEGIDPAWPEPFQLACGPVWLAEDMRSYKRTRALRGLRGRPLRRLKLKR